MQIKQSRTLAKKTQSLSFKDKAYAQNRDNVEDISSFKQQKSCEDFKLSF